MYKNERAYVHEEAVVAERVAGHPHVVELVDAAMAGVGLAQRVLLVYRFAGTSVHDSVKRVHWAPSTRYTQDCMRHVAAGLAHLHAANLVHGDVHLKNIVVSGPDAQPHFVVADLGSAFEAGPNYHMGVMEYNSPERLCNALEVGPRADMFSLGVVLAIMVGFRFPFGNADTNVDQLIAMCKQLGRPVLDELPAAMHKLFRAIPRSPAKGFGPGFRSTHGAPAEDLLERLLRWSPDARPSSLEASRHLFARCGSFSGVGPLGQVEVFDGKRHKWAVQSACLAPDMLDWLRAEIALEVLVSGTPDKLGKFSVAGCTDGNCKGDSMNGRSLKDLLPLPRMRAWICAFRDLNKDAFAQFYVQASGRIVGLEGNLNSQHFLDNPWHTWLLQAAEIHVFPNAAGKKENLHQDGSGGMIHLGLTLFGRRDVVCYQGGGLAPVVLPQFPGALYLGGFTGPEHQVCHRPPLGPDEVLNGHSVAVMFRSTAFPCHHARLQRATPSPKAVWEAVVEEVRAMLVHSVWVLPQLAQCVDKLAQLAQCEGTS